ncbi:type I secretion C-terminal target domain-containing protein [Endozoicomonas ascidiicola]|uniref:type I secretion C-terminal target domain-containing protein n=1 Tax=Endozoicomonas ascidiicola TaxID=1698521 RepID=UPI0008353F05|nr:Ig-like domain-containing protein [Endozoicomonas ascidiicola]
MSDGEVRISHDFGEPLNDGRIGVMNNGTDTSFKLDMAPSNWAPSVENYDLEMNQTEGEYVTTNVLADAVDPQNETLTIESFTQPENGTVENNGDGTFTYTPNDEYSGVDSFNYTISDGTNASTGTIRMNVIANDVLEIDEGGSFQMDISSELVDTDGSETLSVFIDGNPVGSVVSDGSNSFTVTEENTSAEITDWDLTQIQISLPDNYVDWFRPTVRARAEEENGEFSESTNYIRVGVRNVNDAPETEDRAETISEHRIHQFETSDFEFNDADSGANFVRLEIKSLPDGGELKLNDDLVEIGQRISSDDIDNLTYTSARIDDDTQVTFDFTVSDGALESETKTYTLNITSDVDEAPIVAEATDVEGAITELGEGASGESTSTLTENGSFTITADDYRNTQSVEFTATATDYLGSFSVNVGDDTAGDGSGRIDWNFEIDDGDLGYLAEGQTLNQTYTVTVSDGQGGAVDQEVVITLTGTNDAPTISAATDVSATVTEIAEDADGENITVHEETGRFTIADMDDSDNHTVSVSANGDNYRGELVSTLNNDTGEVEWSFKIDDGYLEDLTTEDELDQTYTITVDDGNGATVSQDVTITLTGSDAPRENSWSWNFSSGTSGLTVDGGSVGSDFGETALQFYDAHHLTTHTEGFESATTGSFANQTIGDYIWSAERDQAPATLSVTSNRPNTGSASLHTDNLFNYLKLEHKDGNEFKLDSAYVKSYNGAGSGTIKGYNDGVLQYTLNVNLDGTFDYVNGNGAWVDLVVFDEVIETSNSWFVIDDITLTTRGSEPSSNSSLDPRSVTTSTVDASNSGTLSFNFRYGHASNGSDAVESNEYIQLQYSTDGGSTWTTHQNYNNSSYFNGEWHTINEDLSGNLQQDNIQFRIQQVTNSGEGYDDWAIDDLSITTTLKPTSLNDNDEIAGNDTTEYLIINHDDVTATGGGGADTFDFNTNGSESDVATLTITDFNISENDTLELNDILVDSSNSLTDYVDLRTSGSNTIMDIRAEVGGGVIKRVVFENVNLFTYGSTDDQVLNYLVNNNHLEFSTLAPPVTIDLDGDGIEIITLDESETTFDVDGDGNRENIAWVGADDGFIITDLDGDGILSSREELFIAEQTTENDTDLEALATLYDSNKDGVLNALDDKFDDILIFQDKNQDGVADEGEIITLAEAGITEISVVSDKQQKILDDGSIIHGQTTYTKADGSEGIIGDVELAYEDSPQEATSNSPELLISHATDNELVLMFSETLHGSVENAEFTITIDGVSRIVSSAVINNSEVAITFDGPAIEDDQQLTFDYTGNALLGVNDIPVETISEQLAGFSHSTTKSLDTLIGDADENTFHIDHDGATVTGGEGRDVFFFDVSGMAGDPSDLTITDFNQEAGDVLKVDDILTSSADSLSELFSFSTTGADTIMEIRQEAGGDVTKRVTFKDVDLTGGGLPDADVINNLLDNGNLQADL